MNKTTGNTNGVAEELPTALDVAQAKSQFDETPATTAAWECLRGKTRHAPKEILRDGSTVQVTPQTVQAVLWDTGLDLFTDADRTKAHDLQSWMLASIEASKPFALSSVGAYQLKQRDAIEAKLAAGESTGDMVIESRETINRTFIAHLQAGENARRRKTVEEVIPFCKPIVEKFWSALESHMRDIETTDRQICTAFGITYAPSLLWQACYSVASSYKPEDRLRVNSWSTPAAILGGLFS